MGDRVGAGGKNEFKAKMNVYLETKIIKWSLLVKLQHIAGRTLDIICVSPWLSQTLLFLVTHQKMSI